jgi:hypothetical protein
MVDLEVGAAQGFAPAGYAMAGWWRFDHLQLGKINESPVALEFWPMPGSGADAEAWLKTEDASEWLQGAHTTFLVMFHVED